TLHGCAIEDHSLIGIGATLMDGVLIGRGSIVAGGAFVKEGTIVPPASIVVGIPAPGVRQRGCAPENRLNPWRVQRNTGHPHPRPTPAGGYRGAGTGRSTRGGSPPSEPRWSATRTCRRRSVSRRAAERQLIVVDRRRRHRVLDGDPDGALVTRGDRQRELPADARRVRRRRDVERRGTVGRHGRPAQPCQRVGERSKDRRRAGGTVLRAPDPP